MTLTITPTRLAAKLKTAADTFSQIAEHASTLAECDRWNTNAEQLRIAATLLNNTGYEYVATAQAVLTAAEKLIAAEEAAIHESRASRRERAQ